MAKRAMARVAEGAGSPARSAGRPGPDDALAFELGGPAWRLMRRLGLVVEGHPCVLRRTLAVLAIGWLPLLLLAAWRGDALGATPRESLLLDFATYARLFLGVPLLFATEIWVAPRIRAAGRRFVEGGLVRAESETGLREALARAHRRREAGLPELLLAAVALAAPWYLTLDVVAGVGAREASWAHDAWAFTPAGLWYHGITLPLLQFLALRWTWRWIVWSLFLWDVSRLRLRLLPTHADMAGGLGFLGMAHVGMAIFPFALGSVVSAELAFRIVFEGMTLAALQGMLPVLLAYLACVELLVFGPLLVFVPALAEARREAIARYGALVQRHNQMFHEKWIEGGPEAKQAPIGNPDMSSLVDLGSSFAVVRDMNVLPVTRRQMMQVAVVACLPGLPLAVLTLPLAELAKLLLGVAA